MNLEESDKFCVFVQIYMQASRPDTASQPSLNAEMCPPVSHTVTMMS